MENPFAVPPPLISRKRKAPPAADAHGDQAAFISQTAYDDYSVDGRSSESGMLYQAEAKRLALRIAVASEHAERTAATDKGVVGTIRGLVLNTGSAVSVAHTAPPKHLAELVLERATADNIPLAENIARRVSAIPIADHIEYVKLTQKRTAALAGGIPLLLALRQDEAATCVRLQGIVKQEQEEFETNLVRLASKEHKSEYQNVPQYVDRMYNSFLQGCRNQVTHSYSRFYETQLAVALTSQTANDIDRAVSTMKHLREVAVFGECNVVEEHDLKAGIDLAAVASSDGVEVDLGAQWQPISADPKAEKLMEDFDCDVAMTSSTLMTIFDTSSMGVNTQSAGWSIPVKNRVCVVKGKAKRQLYLDCPLPNAQVTAREKISITNSVLMVKALSDCVNGNVGSRVSYHVWQMGEIKILVRTTTHIAVHEKGATAPQLASVFIKPDYMPLGIEELITPSEFRCMWLHSWLRGGSVILLTRLAPKTGKVTSFSKFSLGSLVRSLGAPGFPDAFEPTDFFIGIKAVLTTLLSQPTVNCILECPHPPGVTTQGRQAHIMRAIVDADRPATDNSTVRPHLMDLFSYIQTCGAVGDDLLGYVLPRWPAILHRIPYTFKTGTYCLEFLRSGTCDSQIGDTKCHDVHLRLKGNREGVAWVFEDYSSIVAAKKMKKVAEARRKVPLVTPDFPFCRGTAAPGQLTRLLQSIWTPIKCPASSECALPHLSLHDIAERVANTLVRSLRQRRKTHKSRNKKRFQHMRDADRPHSEGEAPPHQDFRR